MEALLSSPWGIPFLSIVAMAGGYAHLLRSAHRRIEILEQRCDKHSELPGHPVALQRIAALEAQTTQILAAIQALQASVSILQQQVSEMVGELRATRGKEHA